MRILFVSEYFYPIKNGGEHWAFLLMSELARLGHEVHVVTSRLPKTQREERIRGITIHRVFHSGGILQQLNFMRKLRLFLESFIIKKKIDIVHNMANVVTIPATRAAKAAEVPCVTSVHLSLGDTWLDVAGPIRGRFNRFAERIIFSKSPHSLVHVTATPTKRQLKRLTAAPVKMLLNQLDKAPFTQALKRSDPAAVRHKYRVRGKFLLFLGSIVPVKNVLETISALKKCKEEFTLVLAGDGSDMKRAKELAGKDRRFKFIGRVGAERKYALLGSCDALVLCSKSEQSPISIMEALAFDRTVIATRVGGVPDIANQGFPKMRLLKSTAQLCSAVSALPPWEPPKLNRHCFAVFNKEKLAKNFEGMYEGLLRRST